MWIDESTSQLEIWHLSGTRWDVVRGADGKWYGSLRYNPNTSNGFSTREKAMEWCEMAAAPTQQ